jgi:hypothetical protein
LIALHNGTELPSGQIVRNRAMIGMRYIIEVRPLPSSEDEMQILLVAFCSIAAIWLVVLWGSRFLGPQ